MVFPITCMVGQHRQGFSQFAGQQSVQPDATIGALVSNLRCDLPPGRINSEASTFVHRFHRKAWLGRQSFLLYVFGGSPVGRVPCQDVTTGVPGILQNLLRLTPFQAVLHSSSMFISGQRSHSCYASIFPRRV